MPRRDRDPQDEHEPLLPLHNHRAHSDADTPPAVSDSSGHATRSSTSTASAESAMPISPTIPAAVSLGTASKSKLQARRYLSTSPDSAKRPLLASDSAEAADDGQIAGGSGTGASIIGVGAGADTSESYWPRLPMSHTTSSGQVGMSEKARGKQRARTISDPRSADSGTQSQDGAENGSAGDTAPTAKTKVRMKGRSVTVIFANEGPEGGKVDVWVEEGDSVGMVKDQIRTLHPPLSSRQLRLIHSGRLLTDGVLLLPWLRSLEERVRRQAKGMGGEVEDVLREVGVGLDVPGSASGDGREGGYERGSDSGMAVDAAGRKRSENGTGTGSKVFLHCTVGGVMGEKKVEQGDEDDTPAPRRRGFDTLLDAGLSPADVANMRRQFYESRGEEVPDGLDRDDLDDEHARALEEQWIEGDMTADTATATSEGQYSSILTGLLTGFLYPLLPILFFREMPLPNFFEAEAEANGAAEFDPSAAFRGESTIEERTRAAGIRASGGVGRSGGSAVVGTEVVVSSVFETRVQMGVFLGLVINVIFGALKFLN